MDSHFMNHQRLWHICALFCFNFLLFDYICVSIQIMFASNAQKYGFEDLYPSKNIKRQSLINQYCHWHHENTRKVSAGYLLHIFMPGDKKPNSSVIKTNRKLCRIALKIIENVWLAEHLFIVDNEVSIADILCYEEVSQLKHWNLLKDKTIADSYPNIEQWLKRMSEFPAHEHVHKVFHKLEKFVKQRNEKYEPMIMAKL